MFPNSCATLSEHIEGQQNWVVSLPVPAVTSTNTKDCQRLSKSLTRICKTSHKNMMKKSLEIVTSKQATPTLKLQRCLWFQAIWQPGCIFYFLLCIFFFNMRVYTKHECKRPSTKIHMSPHNGRRCNETAIIIFSSHNIQPFRSITAYDSTLEPTPSPLQQGNASWQVLFHKCISFASLIRHLTKIQKKIYKNE